MKRTNSRYAKRLAENIESTKSERSRLAYMAEQAQLALDEAMPVAKSRKLRDVAINMRGQYTPTEMREAADQLKAARRKVTLANRQLSFVAEQFQKLEPEHRKPKVPKHVPKPGNPADPFERTLSERKAQDRTVQFPLRSGDNRPSRTLLTRMAMAEPVKAEPMSPDVFPPKEVEEHLFRKGMHPVPSNAPVQQAASGRTIGNLIVDQVFLPKARGKVDLSNVQKAGVRAGGRMFIVPGALLRAWLQQSPHFRPPEDRHGRLNPQTLVPLPGGKVRRAPSWSREQSERAALDRMRASKVPVSMTMKEVNPEQVVQEVARTFRQAQRGQRKARTSPLEEMLAKKRETLTIQHAVVFDEATKGFDVFEIQHRAGNIPQGAKLRVRDLGDDQTFAFLDDPHAIRLFPTMTQFFRRIGTGEDAQLTVDLAVHRYAEAAYKRYMADVIKKLKGRGPELQQRALRTLRPKKFKVRGTFRAKAHLRAAPAKKFRIKRGNPR